MDEKNQGGRPPYVPNDKDCATIVIKSLIRWLSYRRLERKSRRCFGIPDAFSMARLQKRSEPQHPFLRPHCRFVASLHRLVLMCNFYSVTKGQSAIRNLFSVKHDRAGNLPSLSARGGVDAAWAVAVLHPFPQGERTF